MAQTKHSHGLPRSRTPGKILMTLVVTDGHFEGQMSWEASVADVIAAHERVQRSRVPVIKQDLEEKFGKMFDDPKEFRGIWTTFLVHNIYQNAHTDPQKASIIIDNAIWLIWERRDNMSEQTGMTFDEIDNLTMTIQVSKEPGDAVNAQLIFGVNQKDG